MGCVAGQASIFFKLVSGWMTARSWTVSEPEGQRELGWAFRLATDGPFVLAVHAKLGHQSHQPILLKKVFSKRAKRKRQMEVKG